MTAPLNPVVEQFVTALNDHDRDRFYGLLTDDATMSDDGVERNLAQWTDSEVFDSNGRMSIDSVNEGGTAFVADYTNSRWGSMRTNWRFMVRDGKISRFETGQA
ncbi:nuclear transport factor 2 family protein [Nocardia bovistercoris]|uniref:nuclear transport factor 2 family protein n=1 Tax=Nocardia bovistercoris TaxID=2785916 RepID=UPI0018AAB21F|nr:nuclear transport factor 2 family protein [Nocardia bovistercoris]